MAEYEKYLLLKETVEDEDEHPLQSVEDGEEVSHHNGSVIEEKQTKGPCQPQETKEDKCSQHPRPAKDKE